MNVIFAISFEDTPKEIIKLSEVSSSTSKQTL